MDLAPNHCHVDRRHCDNVGFRWDHSCDRRYRLLLAIRCIKLVDGQAPFPRIDQCDKKALDKNWLHVKVNTSGDHLQPVVFNNFPGFQIAALSWLMHPDSSICPAVFTPVHKEVKNVAYLDEKIRDQVTQFFQDLKDSVTIQIYPGPEAETAQVFTDLANEVADLSDLVMVSQTSEAPVLEPGHPGNEPISGPIANLLDNQGRATGIRFVGIPSGHEFGAFLEDIKAVSTHTVNLTDKAKEALAQLTQPVHIQVFTTPT